MCKHPLRSLIVKILFFQSVKERGCFMVTDYKSDGTSPMEQEEVKFLIYNFSQSLPIHYQV